ncbi:hypothetical protein WOLCODRAFT_156360 [Wolfiporia cocos MD-104 SS10]|uniref:Uncharacterized protein n=1 Tax=Wolfiporia cocos (strain MD-104) TaxID=742152 RepID=A0A2H3JA90_WOLCO|nr:hypothetical protein WOLCODRAFT_156360 [Wolfiporia cocos MD-104 SS10]
MPSPQPTPPCTVSPTPTHHSIDSITTNDFLLDPPLYDHPIGPAEELLYDHPAGPMEGPIYDQPGGPMEGPIYPYPAGPKYWDNPLYPPPHPLIPTHSITIQVNNVLQCVSPNCEPYNAHLLSMNWYEALTNTSFFYHLHHLNICETTHIAFSNFTWINDWSTKIHSSINISFCDDNSNVITNQVIESIEILQACTRKCDVFNNQISYKTVNDTPVLAASSSAT